MIRYISSFFKRVTTGTNALPYALPYYNTQFLEYSTCDHFLRNIRCTAVHITMHFERNKYIFLTFSTGYHAFPSILLKEIIVYFFFKKLVVTRWKCYKYLLFLFKMYGNMHSNASGYAIKMLVCWKWYKLSIL